MQYLYQNAWRQTLINGKDPPDLLKDERPTLNIDEFAKSPKTH